MQPAAAKNARVSRFVVQPGVKPGYHYPMALYKSLFTPLLFSLLVTGGAQAVQGRDTRQAANPFDNHQNHLPGLGMTPTGNSSEKHLAELAKSFGEASQTDNGLGISEQARAYAFDQFREAVSERVAREAQSLLSPWGQAEVDLQVNDEGEFTGTRGSLFTPLIDRDAGLTWSQLGLTQQSEGLTGNAGLGQRWRTGDWLLGYNTFYDTRFDDHLQRASLGAEAWGENLRFSANYYQPLGSWRDSSAVQAQRFAQGYDLTAQARLPFYRHINTRVSFERYFGERVDLFDNGTGYHDPLAVNVGVSYTPVPLVTIDAQHKQGESGVSQNNLGLKLNYRFGVPLSKQLSASEVANATSLRGSRYDGAVRNNLPVVEYRQRKTLSVYLATPPWTVSPGETVALKLQVRSVHGIKQLTWQGDTQALSLTAPPSENSTDGWTIILPGWNSQPDAANRWQLSVIVEDNKGQRVTSNLITLQLSPPVELNDDSRTYPLLPDE